MSARTEQVAREHRGVFNAKHGLGVRISKNERPHGCWNPMGLLVEDGSIWQCGECKQHWERSRSAPAGWVKISPARAGTTKECEETLHG